MPRQLLLLLQQRVIRDRSMYFVVAHGCTLLQISILDRNSTMDADELRRRYTDGERDFSCIHISNSNLSEISLARANLQGAKLINCQLNYINFDKANLTNADLSGSRLCRANLQEANLSYAILKNTDLNYAELIGADLTGVDLTEAINVSTPHLLLADEDNNTHTELVKVIRKLSRGIHHSYCSESSYPYDVFFWDVASRGDFTLDRFLEAIGLLVEVQLIDLLEGNFPIEDFSFIVERLKPYIINRKYYSLKLGLEWLDIYTTPLLVGNTPSGDWIGICPILYIQRYGREVLERIEDSTFTKFEYQELINTLKNLQTQVSFSSFSSEWEDDSETFTWKLAKNRENLIHNILKSSYLMLYEDLEPGFFGEEEGDWRQEFPESFKKIKTLSALVRDSLKNTRVYSLSDGEVYVYIVGQMDNGNWLGIHTKLIQT